jgi:protein TilB
MMGNPSQRFLLFLLSIIIKHNHDHSNWTDFNSYVIAKLPQLHTLDGTEITRSMQIIANQKLSKMEVELRKLAAEKRIEKELAKANMKDEPKGKKKNNSDNDSAYVEEDENQEPELTDNTPEARVEIYRELAEQKKEKADRESANAPKQRDYEKEQSEALAAIRKKEEETGEIEIKQKNEGGWGFRWDEETKAGCVILDVEVARHLDSSLIDVDIHPTYVSIVIKSKLLRLRLPAEIKVAESKCQRSKTTGSLQVIMPKVNPKENAITVRGDIRYKNLQTKDSPNNVTENNSQTKSTVFRKAKKLSMQEQLLAEAQALEGEFTSSMTVDIKNIVKHKEKSEELSSFPVKLENNTGINPKVTEL